MMSSPLALLLLKSIAGFWNIAIRPDTLSTSSLPEPSSSGLLKLTSGNAPTSLLSSRNF